MGQQLLAVPGGQAFTLSAEVVDMLLRTGDGHCALVFLYLMRHDGPFVPMEAAVTLSLTEEKVNAAVHMLRDLGLVKESSSRAGLAPDVRPDYSSGEIAYGMEKNPVFRHIVDETQRQLGKVLSSSDLQTLYGIFDWRGLPAGVISLLVCSCVENAKRRYGEGRPPTLRQIDKQAALWEEEGIANEEQAEQWIHREEQKRSASSAVFRALRIQGRAPSPSEERYAAAWLAMGFGPEVIECAYDKTVLKTGSLHWKYLDAILQNWHEKGLHTLAEVEAESTVPRAQKTSARQPGMRAPSFASLGRAEMDALARARAYIQEKRG